MKRTAEVPFQRGGSSAELRRDDERRRLNIACPPPSVTIQINFASRAWSAETCSVGCLWGAGRQEIAHTLCAKFNQIHGHKMAITSVPCVFRFNFLPHAAKSTHIHTHHTDR